MAIASNTPPGRAASHRHAVALTQAFLETATPSPRVFAFLCGLLAAAAIAYLMAHALQMTGYTPRLGALKGDTASAADNLTPLQAFARTPPEGWTAIPTGRGEKDTLLFDVPCEISGNKKADPRILVTVMPASANLSRREMTRSLYSHHPQRGTVSAGASNERIFVFENDGEKYFARCAAASESAGHMARNCLSVIDMPGKHEALVQFSENLTDDWLAILKALDPLRRHLDRAESSGDHSRS